MSYLHMALVATLGTWLVTALGAATVVFFRKPSGGLMSTLLGFAAGVMVAASFWSLLAPAIEAAQRMGGLPPWLTAAGGVLCGAAFIWGSDRVVSRAQRKALGGAPRDGGRLRRLTMLVLAITLHNIPEGLAVGVAFGALAGSPSPEGLMGAVSIAVGIGLQNFPEGAAVSLPLRREGCSRLKSFAMGQASGMVEPIAGVAGALMVAHVTTLLPFALSFAAGAMLLVAVHELIPESQQGRSGYTATMGFVLGFVMMMMLDVALG